MRYARDAVMLDGTDWRGRGIECFGELYVFGNVDQHGAGPPTARQPECFMHDLRQVFDALHQEIVLGDGLGNAKDVGFLKGVASDEGPRYLAGDGDDGRGVHERGCQSCDQVGCAWAAGGDAYADFACSAGVAIGGMGGGLFVPAPAHDTAWDTR